MQNAATMLDIKIPDYFVDYRLRFVLNVIFEKITIYFNNYVLIGLLNY